MRERLTRADYRFLLSCAALLVLTVWFSARYFYQAFPEASIDFRVTSRQARGLAERFLQEQGLQVEGYRAARRFRFDDTAKTFLERELGLEQANRLLSGRVRLWRWSNRWFRPLEKEEFRVEVTPAGEIAGFEHQIPEAAARPSLPAAEARALAEDFLRTRMRRDPGALDFVEGSSVTRPSRTDHVFTWKERDFDVHGASYRLEVAILGDQPGGYQEYLKVPEVWLRDYDRLRSKNHAAQSVDTVVTLLVGVGLLITLLLRVRAHDVRWSRAAVVGGIGAVLTLLSSWNSAPLAEFGYPTTDSYASFLSRQLLQSLLSALAAGGLLFVLTAGAEPIYRAAFGSQISVGNLFSRRGLRTRSFFKGAVLGLTLTGVFVAYQTAFYLVAYRFGAWSPADVPYDDLLNTRFPWLFVLLGGYLPAISEEFVFRMFSIPFLRRLLRSMAIAVVLAGFIWGFGHAGYPQQPFYIRGLEVGIGGVALGLIMLRWGILPTLVWHYSVDALYTALLLLRSHNWYFVLSGAATAGMMVLPVVVAWLAYLRRGGFEPAAGLTNQEEGFREEPPSPEAAPVATGFPYPPWTVRRRVAAVVLALAAVASTFVPVERFGNAPRFALGGVQARALADQFLAQRGVTLAAYDAVVFPSTTWQDGMGKYFLERAPMSRLKRAHLRDLPLYAWTVRYYKPLEKEEARVSLDPESGRIFAFDHRLPEDQPGADVGSDEARRLAAAFLAQRGEDLGTLELKETSSEKQKARRDHTLVWEARPGDPRNLEEARYRIRVVVAGDRVVTLQRFWKIPEAFLRARSRQNALAIVLIVARLVCGVAAVVLAIWLLVDATRRRSVSWRSAVITALPFALLGFLGALAAFRLAFRDYNTAIPPETFQAVVIVGLAIAAIGMFLGLSCACGLLLAVRPDALAALRSHSRSALGSDAMLTVGVALGLAVLLAQSRALLLDRFHAQALVFVGAPDLLGSAVPAISALGSAATRTLFQLALLAMVAHVLLRMLRRPWIAPAIALVALASLVPRQARTAGEFLLDYGMELAGLALVVAVCLAFARNNYLAYALAAWSLALGEPILELMEQPWAGFQQQGWILVAALLATWAWAVFPALGRRRADPAEPAGGG